MKENMKENRTKYDAVIIGFGKGGKTMAGALGAAGRRRLLCLQLRFLFHGKPPFT